MEPMLTGATTNTVICNEPFVSCRDFGTIKSAQNRIRGTWQHNERQQQKGSEAFYTSTSCLRSALSLPLLKSPQQKSSKKQNNCYHEGNHGAQNQIIKMIEILAEKTVHGKDISKSELREPQPIQCSQQEKQTEKYKTEVCVSGCVKKISKVETCGPHHVLTF